MVDHDNSSWWISDAWWWMWMIHLMNHDDAWFISDQGTCYVDTASAMLDCSSTVHAGEPCSQGPAVSKNRAEPARHAPGSDTSNGLQARRVHAVSYAPRDHQTEPWWFTLIDEAWWRTWSDSPAIRLIMMNHDDAPWSIISIHHNEWSWFGMMNHHGSSA